MKFGWLTLGQSPAPGQDADRILTLLDQAALAEDLGFDGLWLTEHHFSGESIYSDPVPFAAALCTRTRRIRIGFAVLQLALHHPVRLAVQLSLLDNLSGGRLDIGVGRGTLFNEFEFVGFGLRSTDARERMSEALSILTRALTGGPVVHTGTFFSVAVPELRPRPVQRPTPPIWHAVASATSFRHCGCNRHPILIAPLPLGKVRDGLQDYALGLQASGLSQEKQSRLLHDAALWRWVYVGGSRAAAEDELATALMLTRQTMYAAREHNPPDFRVDPLTQTPWTDSGVSHEDAVRHALRTSAIVGSYQDVAEQVAELRNIGVGHLLCQMSIGYLDHEKTIASMKRFATAVMPYFAAADTRRQTTESS
jgi:alkanesulfonate monooxygenase SsuD/methylene tetrahydromethanopterin reductase-like flavin-dependent oxidoreductase (luciferase family)